MLEIYIDVRNNDRLLVNTDLYRYTRDNLTSAINKVYPGLKYDHPDFDMAMNLRNNASRFAGYKTAWQVAELRDVDDTDSINSINKKYNTNYMRSEYEHTVRSTRAAKNWQKFDQDKDLYPFLEYMPSTSGTPRSEHKKLYGVIKALDDPFWDTWLPPADWGCKCSVQQRRSDKGTTEPPEEIKLPPQAMRNNPGKDGHIFTDKHPMIGDVGKKEAKEIDAETERLERKTVRNEAFGFMRTNFAGKSFKLETNAGMIRTIPLTNTNIKEILNQPTNNINLKNELGKQLDHLIDKATYLFDAPSEKVKYKHFYYFKIDKLDLMINVALRESGEYVLYTITDVKNPV